MKSIHIKGLMVLCLMAFSIAMFSQDDKSKRKSPPADVEYSWGDNKLEINYSSPSVRGREVWDALVPYDRIWRTGANEATTFAVNNDIYVEGQALPAGRYSLFTVPGKEKWVIVFNKDADQWGSYSYSEDKDALRVEVEPSKSDEFVEAMRFEVEESDSGANIVLRWENLQVPVKIR